MVFVASRLRANPSRRIRRLCCCRPHAIPQAATLASAEARTRAAVLGTDAQPAAISPRRSPTAPDPVRGHGSWCPCLEIAATGPSRPQPESATLLASSPKRVSLPVLLARGALSRELHAAAVRAPKYALVRLGVLPPKRGPRVPSTFRRTSLASSMLPFGRRFTMSLIPGSISVLQAFHAREHGAL